MLYLVSGINSLYLFVNLILVPVPPFLLTCCSPITSSSFDSVTGIGDYCSEMTQNIYLHFLTEKEIENAGFLSPARIVGHQHL